MLLSSALINELGDELYRALTFRRAIAPLSERYADIGIEDAYRIQQRMVACRVEHGERIAGKKIGVTSRAVMDNLGVAQPDFGYILDGMIHNEGQPVELSSLIQPRAEGEIAFVMKRDVQGPGISAADIIAATEGVMACVEVVDSRIRDWKIKIQDTVADNASCGVLVLGDRLVDIKGLDLSTCGMTLEKNGEIVATGAGAASLGSPVNAMVWLANTLGSLEIPFKAGEVVLSGALGAMVPVAAGDSLHLAIGGVGDCSVRFA